MSAAGPKRRTHSFSNSTNGAEVKPGGNWKALQKTLGGNTSPNQSKRRRVSSQAATTHSPSSSMNATSTNSLVKGKGRAVDGVREEESNGSKGSSPAPTGLPWFAEDLSPEDLALVRNLQSDPSAKVRASAGASTSGVVSGGGIGVSSDEEEQRQKKRIILGGHWGEADSQAKKEPGHYIAIDCEMVGVGPKGCESILARVSIVNWHGYVLLDRFVRPMERVTDYRTWVSGIRASDLKGAPSLQEVQEEVAALIKGRVLVGHAIQNDLKALLLAHPRPLIRDTSTFKPLRDLARTKHPGLRKLANLVLGIEIQKAGEEHSSVEDARTTMAIFRTQKDAWERTLKGLPADGGSWDSAAPNAKAASRAKAGMVGAGQPPQPGVDKGTATSGDRLEQKMSRSMASNKSKPDGSDDNRRGPRPDRPKPRRPAEAQPGWWKESI